MIRHCVFIRFKPDTADSQKEEIYRDIAALVGRIDGMLAVHAGPNQSPEGLDKGHGDGFVIDFADRAAAQRYQDDPDHKKAGAKIVAQAVGGKDGVFVYDIEADA